MCKERIIQHTFARFDVRFDRFDRFGVGFWTGLPGLASGFGQV